MVDKGVCKGCKKPILWWRNENGKAEPFDARPTRTLGVEKHEIHKVYLPHFVTCPDRDKFRRK